MRADLGQRQHYIRSNEKKLVRNWVKNGAELGFLVKAPRKQSVESIGNACNYKNPESGEELAVKEQRHENWNEDHSEDGQYIRKCYDA